MTWRKTKKQIQNLKDRLAHKTEFAESLVAQRDRLWEENETLKEALGIIGCTAIETLNGNMEFKRTIDDDGEVCVSVTIREEGSNDYPR